MGRIGRLAWQWIKTHAAALVGFIAGAGIAGGILVLAAVVGARDIQQTESSEKIAHDWQRAMMTLGIMPVFPPSEDFHVGGIIAVIEQKPGEKMSDGDNGPSSILFRTIGIAHVSETAAALKKHYKDIPQFPRTPEKYDGTSPVTMDGDIFTLPDGLNSLPIVAFPDSTIATASVQTAGFGVLPGIRAVFSGATRTKSESVQIKIPEAETYGVGAEEALRLLMQFCSENTSCTEAGVRAALSLPDEAKDQISIRFITRVYLTRSIDYHYGSDTAVAAAVRAALDRSTTGQTPAPAAAPGLQPPTGTQTPQQTLESARAQAIRELEGLGQGGQLTSASATSAGAVLKMQFARPVAIGYQCLSIGPYPEVLKPEVANNSKTSTP